MCVGSRAAAGPTAVTESEREVEVKLLARGRGPSSIEAKVETVLCKACTKERLVEAFQGM